jgi:hypothetical protein
MKSSNLLCPMGSAASAACFAHGVNSQLFQVMHLFGWICTYQELTRSVSSEAMIGWCVHCHMVQLQVCSLYSERDHYYVRRGSCPGWYNSVQGCIGLVHLFVLWVPHSNATSCAHQGLVARVLQQVNDLVLGRGFVSPVMWDKFLGT